MFDGDLGFVQEYTGEIDTAELGSDLAEPIGDETRRGARQPRRHRHRARRIEEATYRSASFDRQCRLMVDVLQARPPYTAWSRACAHAMKDSLIERGSDVFWDGEVRHLLRTQPDVLA